MIPPAIYNDVSAVMVYFKKTRAKIVINKHKTIV